MRQEMATGFIVIDDDSINNDICIKLVKLTYPGMGINAFTTAVDGLEYITENYKEDKNKRTVLFLDINIPGMNGWEFLEQLEKLPASVLQQFRIFILSSSICPEDEEKAAMYICVSGFINKPFTQAKLKGLFAEE